MPDLTVNISVTNVLNNSVNGSVQFLINYTITYKNIGNVAAYNVTVSSGESMACNSGGGSGSGGGFQIPALNPNQAISSASSSVVNCYGLWSASAAIDITNIISELNENNNNASVSRSI